MREKILEALKGASSNYVSGEELSRLLGVSRTAIWKHIKILKEEGYKIDSISRQGYRLVERPDILYPREVASGLIVHKIGKQLVHRDQVDSTNALARRMAEDGVDEGTVILAEEQLGGRGRLGRPWTSPRGLGIWTSAILRPAIPPAEAPGITILAAVAVVFALAKAYQLQAGIKWPNDILINGKKVCGILTEMKAEIDAVAYVILGIGLNVNLAKVDLPQEARDRSTSVSLELGKKVSRTVLLRILLQELDCLYQEFLKGGFPEIRKHWLENNITLGHEVKITSLRDEYSGLAIDIDAGGALIVRCDDGETRVFNAGEVTLGRWVQHSPGKN